MSTQIAEAVMMMMTRLVEAMEGFQWTGAPLSRFSTVGMTSVCYVACAVLARRLFPGGSETRAASTGPSYALAVHNGVLSVASLVMCVGCSVECWRRATAEGSWDFFFCERREPPAAGRVYFWAYCYYLSKYYELLDTCLAFACRGAPPRFFVMHVYHHACVLFMAWFYLEAKQSLAFGGLGFNTLVHVVMYYYYARTALQLDSPWKRWVTRLQILQFATSFLLLATTGVGYLGRGHDCAGQAALAYNSTFNATLLFLFFGVLAAPSKKKRTMAEKRRPHD